MKRKTAVFVALAATLLAGMAIVAAVNSPLLNKTAQTYFKNPISDTEYENIALQHVAQTHGIHADELEVGAKVLRHFPSIDKEVWQMRVVGKRNRSLNESGFENKRAIYEVFIDRDGEVIDKNELLLNAKPAGTGNDTEIDYENIALQHIAQTHGIPIEELVVSNKVQRHLRMLDKKVWQMGILKKSWNIKKDKGPLPSFDVFMDLDGNILDEDEFKELEEQDKMAYREKYGKLRPSLYNRLQSMQPNETIRVIIDLTGVDTKAIEKKVLSKYPSIEIIENLTDSPSKRENPDFDIIGHIPVFIRDGQLNRSERGKIHREFYAAKSEAYLLKEKPLLDYLTAKGYDARGAGSIPTVFATLPKKEIIALQTRDDVAKIWLSLSGGPGIDTSVPTIRANKACSACGYDEDFASWSRIAIVEKDRVDFSNPYLHGDTRPGQYDVGGHATQCAGVAASNHPTIYKGVACNATILTANAADTGTDEDIRDALGCGQ